VIVGPCTVVTGGTKPQVIEDGAVRVIEAHISHVGTAGALASAYPDDMRWPGRGRVLMPGLVNTHSHLARHLARGLPLRSPRDWQRFEKALSPEDVYWGVQAALAEGVRHGVTAVFDFHRAASSSDATLDEAVEAARRLGVRAGCCYGASEEDTLEERIAALEEAAILARALERSADSRLRALAGVRPMSLEGTRRLVREACEITGTKLPLHVDLTLDLTPAERWGTDAGDPDLSVLWAHAEAAPRDLLAFATERGDLLSAAGSGSAAAIMREAELGWGSDSGVNAPPLPDATHGWVFGARAEAHYRRLFVNGPRFAAASYGEGFGTIAPGAPADMVLLDYRPPTEFSGRTLSDHLWTGLLRAPVAGVMVGGEIVMDNGVLIGVDEREVFERARECSTRLWARIE